VNIVLPQTPAELSLGHPLPHRRMEEWRWTDLRRMIDRPYPKAAVKTSKADVARLIKASPFAKVAGQRMVFVNGQIDPALSQIANGDVASRVQPDDPLLALNAALMAEGASLTLAGNVDTPIELIFIATKGQDRTIATRNVIEIADGASATIVETHLGEGGYINNSVTEIRVGARARLDRVKVEHEAADAIHLGHAHITLGADAKLNDFTLTSGAKLNRQNGNIVFTGQNAEARVSGAYMLAAKQHADTRLIVDHQVPHCLSRELFKCVLDGESRGIFQGKAIVRKDAQKTDGKQSSHALLLSETAEFDAKPELEIFADDVVCGHGATAGDLNHDHLFYLESRGIPPAQAKSMLIAAFVAEAFETIAHEGIRESLEGFASTWLTDHRKS
jgi:Fe-S cluster assembly protein SufD